MGPRHDLKGSEDTNPNPTIACTWLDEVILATGYKTTEKWESQAFSEEKTEKTQNWEGGRAADGILDEITRILMGLEAENRRRE